MLELDLERVRANAHKASTEDLLNRVTAYRAGMEPAAIQIIEAELRERGVDRAALDAHAAQIDTTVLQGDDGVALRCSFCLKPAVAASWGWHRLWRTIPLFPRWLRYCQEHRPAGLDTPA